MNLLFVKLCCLCYGWVHGLTISSKFVQFFTWCAVSIGNCQNLTGCTPVSSSRFSVQLRKWVRRLTLVVIYTLLNYEELVKWNDSHLGERFCRMIDSSGGRLKSIVKFCILVDLLFFLRITWYPPSLCEGFHSADGCSGWINEFVSKQDIICLNNLIQ